MVEKQEWRLISGIILISAGCLMYEIALTRLLAVQQFHHFAFLVVSLAVLGFAASGVMLSSRRFTVAQHWLAVVYAAVTVIAYLILNLLPFDSYSIAWDSKQIWILLLYFFAAGLPFMFAGWAVGIALVRAGEQAYRPYAANLIGSAGGCVLAPVMISLGGAEAAVGTAAALGLLAGSAFAANRRVSPMLCVAALICAFAFLQPPPWLQLQLSPYKPLQIAKLMQGAQVTQVRRSASTRLDVVEGAAIHVFPGLALTTDVELPHQLGLFLDGEGPLPVTQADPGDAETIKLAGHMPGDIAYRLRPHADVLILEPGAGLPALMAISSGAAHIVYPTDEPLVLEALLDDYQDISSGLLSDLAVRISPRTSRGTLSLADGSFDIVEFALSDGFRPVTSGAFSLTEDYVLTVEAIQDAWDRLEDGGLLVITRWIHTPPSESARVWSTVLKALHERGVTSLETRLAAFRGMRTATILAAKQPFSTAELDLVREFLHQNRFDPLYLPDLRTEELNRFNRLPEPVYHELFVDLLQDYDRTLRDYDFQLRPVNDMRPYFAHFFRWGQTPQILASLGRFWQPFGGSGYLVLLILLILMVVLASILTLVPAILMGRRGMIGRPSFAAIAYFAALGVGYLAVEVPLLQSFGLLLDRPAISIPVVLFTLLLASGVGSVLSPRIPLKTALALLAGILIIDVALLSPFIHWAMKFELPVRLFFGAVFMLPAGFLMGVPFAAGLARLERGAQGWIPWAWAVNGAFSGVSGVAAAMISLDLGFQATLMAGACAYTLAYAVVPKLQAFKSGDSKL
ncbi:MAG: hypothetical protein P8X64_03865 [Anaerolineales bacterium]